jgi:hypothetical protein
VELAGTNSFVLDQTLDLGLRIGSWTENEHNWSLLSGLLVNLLVHNWWRLDIELISIHLGNDEPLDGIDGSIRSEDSDQKKLLELVIFDLIVVVAW